MLVLSRKTSQKIVIDDSITLEVLDIKNNGTVVFGIEAPRDMPILRTGTDGMVQTGPLKQRVEGITFTEIPLVDPDPAEDDNK